MGWTYPLVKTLRSDVFPQAPSPLHWTLRQLSTQATGGARSERGGGRSVREQTPSPDGRAPPAAAQRRGERTGGPASAGQSCSLHKAKASCIDRSWVVGSVGDREFVRRSARGAFEKGRLGLRVGWERLVRAWSSQWQRGSSSRASVPDSDSASEGRGVAGSTALFAPQWDLAIYPQIVVVEDAKSRKYRSHFQSGKKERTNEGQELGDGDQIRQGALSSDKSPVVWQEGDSQGCGIQAAGWRFRNARVPGPPGK